MNALEIIKRDMANYAISEIVSNERVATRGYVFVVEYKGNFYSLVNSRDLDAAIASLYMSEDRGHTYDYVNGATITESFSRALEIAQGVFVCSSPVK